MTEPAPAEMKSRLLPRLREELDALRLQSDATAEHRKPVDLDQQSVGRLSRMDAMQQAMAAARWGERFRGGKWRRERSWDPTFSNNRGRFRDAGGVKAAVL